MLWDTQSLDYLKFDEWDVIQFCNDTAKHQKALLVLVHFGADFPGDAVFPTMSAEGELGGGCLGGHRPCRPSYGLPRVAFPPLIPALDD